MGLAYVAPIGMQNLFIINTALTQNKSRIYLTALIVIFFDVTLAIACFFGVGAIMKKSPWLEMTVLLIGSITVIYIGSRILCTKSSLDTLTDVNVSVLKVISTACVVTWFNPQALIDGSMMLGAFKATLSANEASKFILGVAVGSTLWFLGISTLIPIIRDKFNHRVLRLINIVCGIVIIFYGIKLHYHFWQIALQF